ncbi:hypothetical protein SAMN05216562_0809 [Microbulbifer marinus]|uniref:Uncharacterized protein n=1 Tax=Microbulbifer marinus TaxID=658218 RepID=A0A1H3WF88_9GAMM|nr:hypothetical protein SAMN05216562_0809 [Microbulbifer marinus]
MAVQNDFLKIGSQPPVLGSIHLEEAIFKHPG